MFLQVSSLSDFRYVIPHPSFLNLARSVCSSSAPGSGTGGSSSEVEVSEGGFEEMDLGSLW